MAVRAGGTGDVTRTHVAWTLRRGAPYTPSPLLVGEELYYVSDMGVFVVCRGVDRTDAWQQRLGGNYSASPVFADGRVRAQRRGRDYGICPRQDIPQAPVNRLDGTTLASIAISNGSLFIRSQTHLYRIASSSLTR